MASRAVTAAARARDEAVAEVLLAREASIHELARVAGCHPSNLSKRIFPRLADRGLPVVEVGRYNDRAFGASRRGRQTTLYRIVLPRGRVCSAPGCGTVLRRSNPSERCELHGGGVLDFGEVKPMSEVHAKARW